jgi:hypothetical protein
MVEQGMEKPVAEPKMQQRQWRSRRIVGRSRRKVEGGLRRLEDDDTGKWSRANERDWGMTQ